MAGQSAATLAFTSFGIASQAMLFLFFAEGRGLVPLWHPLYRASYSAEALREAALDLALQGETTLEEVARVTLQA